MFNCPICDQNTLTEDPLQESSTHEICKVCHYQSGYDDGGGKLIERSAKFKALRKKYSKSGTLRPEKKVINNIDSVIKPRGQSFEIITENNVLRTFLEPGGDYVFWFSNNRRDQDILQTSGGNIIDWKLVDPETVELSSDYETPPCLISKDVLWNVIDKLAASRHLVEKYAANEMAWKRHHDAWLLDKKSCPADKTRKNCGDRVHEDWEKQCCQQQ